MFNYNRVVGVAGFVLQCVPLGEIGTLGGSRSNVALLLKVLLGLA